MSSAVPSENSNVKGRNVQWVFLGCLGVGKGTYAAWLSKILSVPYIATGDLVRLELSSRGPLSSQERIPVEEVFEQLKCTREGLTSDEGENRLKIFGLNKLEEKKESKLLKFLGFMWNPLSWVMEVPALMAIALSNEDVSPPPPDWQDFVGIVALLFINSTISKTVWLLRGSIVMPGNSPDMVVRPSPFPTRRVLGYKISMPIMVARVARRKLFES